MHKKRLSEDFILKQRKKILLGIMDILILEWIKKNPISGQEIMDRIKTHFNVMIGPGTMYPILFSLKKRNLVYTEMDKKRKLYLLTNKGRETINTLKKDHSNIQKAVYSFLKKK